jgi:hypothetical protein
MIFSLVFEFSKNRSSILYVVINFFHLEIIIFLFTLIFTLIIDHNSNLKFDFSFKKFIITSSKRQLNK